MNKIKVLHKYTSITQYVTPDYSTFNESYVTTLDYDGRRELRDPSGWFRFMHFGGVNVWAIIATMLVVCTAGGNILVCLAIYLERRLQNVTNYFLMSLAITDCMVAVLVMPLGILSLVKGYFPLPAVYCLLWICLDVLLCTASIMHLCTISVDRFGQETVQDIVSRTQDVFQTLKAIQPPNGTQLGENASNDKKTKMQEQLRTIRLLFKRLRLVYDKCNETCQGMEYTHMESLIPLKDEADNKTLDERRNTESYRRDLEENRELTEQVVLKNKQLKEVITNLRTIIWEINVMLTMRRS